MKTLVHFGSNVIPGITLFNVFWHVSPCFSDIYMFSRPSEWVSAGLKSHEFIKDKLLKLDWEEMQEVVAGLLRSLGYKTYVSRLGPDRGKDVIASPDGLGLEYPRILAEVKHQPNNRFGAPDVRSFIGALRKDDRGLYISTGGFTKEAHYEAERAQVPVTLIDIDDLATMLIKKYENLDIETRTLIPLVRVYWPAT